MKFKKQILLLFFLFIPFFINAQSPSKRYKNPYEKKQLINVKKIFRKKSTEEKVALANQKKIVRNLKVQKKTAKKYQKQMNSENYMPTGKKTYKKMKKSEKAATRINQDKNRDRLLKRKQEEVSKNISKFRLRLKAKIFSIFTKEKTKEE